MTIVSCPKCNEKVTVPSSAPKAARVRCPLCQDEYDLVDALAQLPPLLIVVSTATVEEPALAAVGAMDAATGAEIGSALDHDFGISHAERPSEFSSDVLDAGPRIEDVASAPTPAFRSQPRPRRKEKSMVGELVKIVLGGVVGIVLAVLILWWGPGVDLGLAPTIAKVKPMRWILPPTIRDKADRINGEAGGQEGTTSEDSKTDLQPLSSDSQAAKSGGPFDPGSRFEEAMKSSGTENSNNSSSGKSAKTGSTGQKSKSASTKPVEVDPFAPAPDVGTEVKSSSPTGVGELKIESPLDIEKKPAKKTEPAKTKPEEPTPEEPKTEDKPAEKKTSEPEKPAVPAEEKPAADKPAKPEDKPEKTEPAAEKPEAPADLSSGIDAANSAAKAFDETDAADKEAWKTAVVALYNAYAGLGNAVAQANLEDADNAEKLPALRQTLAQAANDPVKLNSIGTLAARQLDGEEAGAGILLAGTVKDFRAAGSLFETTIELIRVKRLVKVVADKNPQDSYKVDDQVLILGSIVREPKEKLPGYKGEASVVVKCGHAMLLPAEKKGE